MTPNDPVQRMRDMLDHARMAVEAAAGATEAELSEDWKLRFATLHAIMIIGEAASKVPEDVRERFPEVEFRGARAMRNFVVHVYEGINVVRLHDVVQRDLGPMIKALESALADIEGEVT